MAQLLPLLASPVLARLYSPVEFGVFGLFFSLCAISSVVASGRYELAILLPAEHERAYHLVLLAAGLTVVVALLAGLVGWLEADYWSQLLGEPGVARWLPLVSIGIVSTAGYQVFNYWFNRQERYRLMAGTRTLRSAVQVMASIGFGLIQGLAGGLVLGWLTGQLSGLVAFVRQFLQQTKPYAAEARFATVREVARRYARFPAFSVPADSINVVTAQMPLWILATYFDTSVTGQVFFTQRVLAAPLGVIGAAFGDVFKQRASLAFIESGRCDDVWRKTFKVLLLIALPIGAVVVLGGPFLFKLIFGDDWMQAGHYARLLSPYILLAFVASPLSRVVYVAEKQHFDLMWQIILLIVTLGGLLYGSHRGDPELAVTLYAVAYSFMYVIYLLMSYQFAKGRTR